MKSESGRHRESKVQCSHAAPDYENLIRSDSAFPVDVFVQDNRKKQVDVSEHFHDCFELLYFLSGEARQFINGHSFRAGRDDIILIRSGDIHSTYCTPGADCRILVLKFMPSMLDSGYIIIEGSKYLAAFLNYVTTSEIKGLTAGELDELRSVLMNMLDEYSNKRKAYEIRIKGYIFETVALLVRYNLVSIPGQQLSAKDLQRIGSVIRLIETSYMKPLTLEDVSKSLNLNYSYVSRYFKKVAGKNFKEYLDYIRICEAERMMLQRTEFLYEIAERCGFASVQAFNRVYRRIRGCTPTQMMKM
ncbi:MAG: AraC family transcriptional regulator [Saccharofermentanales bacterium]